MPNWPTEQLLAAIAKASPRDCVTEAQLAEATGKDAKSIENSCNVLRRRGLIRRTANGCHTLTAAGHAAIAEGARLRSGPKGPRSGHLVRACTLRCRAWHAMRIKGKFSLDDVLMLAIDGGERDARSNLGKYVRMLVRAGYLRPLAVREAGTAPTSNGAVRYLLLRNTGPIAPVCMRGGDGIFDPNTEERHALARNLPRPRALKRREARC